MNVLTVDENEEFVRDISRLYLKVLINDHDVTFQELVKKHAHRDKFKIIKDISALSRLSRDSRAWNRLRAKIDIKASKIDSTKRELSV